MYQDLIQNFTGLTTCILLITHEDIIKPGDHDGSPRGSGPHRNRAHHHHREQFWNASVSAEPAEEPPEDHFEDANADESHSNDDGGASDALNSLSFGDVDDLHDGGETDQVK